jgi:predicted DNA-binding protein (UPF0251 family)
MPRPRKQKRITVDPSVTYFKPRGVPMSELEEVVLSHEEFEALRLKHVKKLEQTEAAKEMHISQSTFQRLLSSAHQTISDSVVNGKAIKINNNT